MTLWWLLNAILILAVIPVVVYLLHGVLTAARSIVPSVQEIAKATAAGSKDLDATVLLLTTQQQVADTVAGVANYGGSLNVILDELSDPKVPSKAIYYGGKTKLGGETIRCTGNSFATPHVAGICALIRSKHPELTPFELKSLLHLTSRNVADRR